MSWHARSPIRPATSFPLSGEDLAGEKRRPKWNAKVVIKIKSCGRFFVAVVVVVSRQSPLNHCQTCCSVWTLYSSRIRICLYLRQCRVFHTIRVEPADPHRNQPGYFSPDWFDADDFLCPRENLYSPSIHIFLAGGGLCLSPFGIA